MEKMCIRHNVGQGTQKAKIEVLTSPQKQAEREAKKHHGNGLKNHKKNPYKSDKKCGFCRGVTQLV